MYDPERNILIFNCIWVEILGLRFYSKIMESWILDKYVSLLAAANLFDPSKTVQRRARRGFW